MPENEFSMMTLARLVGMDVPALRLVDIGAIRNLPDGIGTLEGQALVIERFDRLPDGGVVHVRRFRTDIRGLPRGKIQERQHAQHWQSHWR